MEDDEADLSIINKRPESSRDSRVEGSKIGSDVFSRLVQPRNSSRAAQGSFAESAGSFLQSSELPKYEDDHNWKCKTNKDQAHNAQICALASVGNQLYSTSNKSLKIWDLETMQVVSDI